MNVSTSTQFELALLLRTLKILKSCPDVCMSTFFEEMMPFLQGAPDRSLSAYWKEKYESTETNLISLVNANSSSSGDGADGEGVMIMRVRELEYLKNVHHIDKKHDPLSIVRTIFNTAIFGFYNAVEPEQRNTLLLASTLLGAKSARASLFLHTALLSYAFKEEIITLPKEVILDIYELVCDAASRDVTKTISPIIVEHKCREYGTKSNKKLSSSSFVLSFGKSDHGKLGHGDLQLNRQIPTIIDALRSEDVRKVVSMSTYALAMNGKGQVYIWGTGGSVGAVASGRLSISPQPLEAIPTSVFVKDVSCGLGHTLFLSSTGQVWAWGNGGNGRCGLGDVYDRTEACRISSLSAEVIVSIQCGASHSLALTDKGQMYSWGKNSQGQCGHGNLEDILKPALVKKFHTELLIENIAAGWEHSLALTKQGKLYTWGCGYKDSRRGIIPPVLGLGHNECRPSPELVTSLESIVITGIASGWDHCLAVDKAGKLLSWGSGQNGKLGHGNEENISVPCYIPALENVKIISFSAGCEHSAAITVDGELFVWGHGDGGRLGIGNNAQSFVPVKVNCLNTMHLRTKQVHCGDKFTLIISEHLPASNNVAEKQANQFDISSFAQEDFFKHNENKASEKSEMDFTIDALVMRKEYFLKLKSDELIEVSITGLELSSMLLHMMLMAGINRLPLCSVSLSSLLNTASNGLVKDMLDSSILALSDDFEYSTEISEDTYLNMSILLEAVATDFCRHLSKLTQQSHLQDMSIEEATLSAKSSKSKFETKDNLEIDDSFIACCYELKAHFELLKTLLLVCSVNMLALGIVLSKLTDGKTEEEISDILELRFLQFVLRREDVKDDKDSHRESLRSQAQQHNDALSFHSQESEEASFGMHEEQDDNDYSRTGKRQRNHSHRSHHTKQYNVRDEDEDFLSKGESTDFDNDGSLDESLSQEGSLQDQQERSRNGSVLQSPVYTNTHDSILTDEHTMESAVREEGLTQEVLSQKYEQEDRINNYADYRKKTNENRNLLRGDHHSLSPAPSYESLENSCEEEKDGDYANTNLSASYNMNGVYNEEFLEKEDAESIEFQQALLSSITNSKITLMNKKFFKNIEQRRGQACIPTIRNHINTLASQSFVTLRNILRMKSLFSRPNGTIDDALLGDVHLTVQNTYAVWDMTQSVTSLAFDSLYNKLEQQSILTQIIQSPSSFLYILPGIVGGLKRKGSLQKSMLQYFSIDYMFEANIYDLAEIDDQDKDKSILRTEDIVQLLEHFQSLYSDDIYRNVLENAVHGYDSTQQSKETFLSLHKMVISVRVAFSEMVGNMLTLVCLRMRSTFLQGSLLVRQQVCTDEYKSIVAEVYSLIAQCIKLELKGFYQLQKHNHTLSSAIPKYFQSSMTQLLLPTLCTSAIQPACDSSSVVFHYSLVFNIIYSIFTSFVQQYDNMKSINCKQGSFYMEWLGEQATLVLGTLADFIFTLCMPPSKWFPLHESPCHLFQISQLYLPGSGTGSNDNDNDNDNGFSRWKSLVDNFLTQIEVNTWCKLSEKLVNENICIQKESSNGRIYSFLWSNTYNSLCASIKSLENIGILPMENNADNHNTFQAFVVATIRRLKILLDGERTHENLVFSNESLDIQITLLLFAVFSSIYEENFQNNLLTALVHTFVVCSHKEDEEYKEEVLSVILENLYQYLNSFLVINRVDSNDNCFFNYIQNGSSSSESSKEEMNSMSTSAAINKYIQVVKLFYDIIVYDEVTEELKGLLASANYEKYCQSAEASMMQMLTKYQTSTVSNLHFHVSLIVWRQAVDLNKQFGLGLFSRVCEKLSSLPIALQDNFYDKLSSQQKFISTGVYHSQALNLHMQKEKDNGGIMSVLFPKLADLYFSIAQVENLSASVEILAVIKDSCCSIRHSLYQVNIIDGFHYKHNSHDIDALSKLFGNIFAWFERSIKSLNEVLDLESVQYTSENNVKVKIGLFKGLQMMLLTMKDSSLTIRRLVQTLEGSCSESMKMLSSYLLTNMLACILLQEKLMFSVYRKVDYHLQFCEQFGCVYLYAKQFDLESHSPVITAGLSAPNGCFSINMHVFLPYDFDAKFYSKEDNGSICIHLLSRIQETGDLNLVDLVSINPSKLDCYSLSLHLVYTLNESQMQYKPYLQIDLITYNIEYDKNAKRGSTQAQSNVKKTTAKYSFTSPELSAGWHNIHLEVQQLQNSVNKVTNVDELVGIPKEQVYDQTLLFLYIDQDLVMEKEVGGGRWPLYQSMVLGKLPLSLCQREEILYQSQGGSSNIALADILWIPNLVYSKSPPSNKPYAKLSLIPYPCSSLISLLTICNTTLSTVLNTFRMVSKNNSDYYMFLSTHLLALLPCLSNLLIISNSTAQQTVLNLLQDIITHCPDLILNALTMSHASGAGQGEGGNDFESSLDSTTGPVGSTVNVIYTFKLNNAITSLLTTLLSIVVSFIHPNIVLNESAVASSSSYPQIVLWYKRAYFNRIGSDQYVNNTHWMPMFYIDENVLLIGISIMFNQILKHFYKVYPNNFLQLYSMLYSLLQGVDVYSSSSAISRICVDMIYSINVGGWFPIILLNNKVYSYDRRTLLYYQQNQLLPGTASSVYSNNTTILQCSQIDYIDAYKKSYYNFPAFNEQSQMFAIYTNSIPMMQKIYNEDMNKVYTLDTFYHLSYQNSIPVNNIYITKSLHGSHSLSPNNQYLPILAPASNQMQLLQSELITTHDNIDLIHDNVDLMDMVYKQISSYHNKDIEVILKNIIGINKQSAFHIDQICTNQNPLHELMMMVSSLRSLSVLFYETFTSGDINQTMEQMKGLLVMLQNSLPHLLSIAALDPIESASQIFVSSHFKGVQVDVLRNLLRESDILFLEKLSSKLFKQYNIYTQYNFNLSFVGNQYMNIIQLVPLAGEVYIGENKVRAISHFPSVRLQNINLSLLVGRWYYEVTLLSDGLMQIGWANSLFKCDPICGQGVGDHNQSWAYDGLRTKKWNVSCEPYGKRWHAGDVVGVLVDMDLLEMKYFLNGEDLGAAFEDFNNQQHDLFPAFSLNVRQCIRLNFGQHKFLYPPNEIDKKSFQPILTALLENADKSSSKERINGNKENYADVISAKEASSKKFTNNPAVSSGTANRAVRAVIDEVSRIMEDSSSSNQVLQRILNAAETNNAATPAINTTNASSNIQSAATSPLMIPQPNGVGSNILEASNEETEEETRHRNNNDGNSVVMDGNEAENIRRYMGEGSDGEDDDDDDEERDHDEDDEQRFLLEQQWHADLEARMRMEAEEDQDDYDVDEERESDDEEEDEEDDEDEANIYNARVRGQDHADGSEQEGDEEEDDEGMNTSAMRAAALLNATTGSHGSNSAHMVELRRQAMVESLIGMGFPVDWALRAAEHCDSSSSESAAISWIIERMEMEQSNINELEQDSSSRAAEGEEFDDLEGAGIEYFMQRHAGVHGASNTLNNSSTGRTLSTSNERTNAINRRLVAEHMAELLESANIGLQNANAVLSPGSPTREESFGFRSNLNHATALGMMLRDDAAYAAYLSSKLQKTLKSPKAERNGENVLVNKELESFDLAFSDTAVWNNEPLHLPVIPGVYTSRRRHDADKQEVLAQVTELDVLDMISIVATCEYALCIYYARSIFLRIIQCSRLSAAKSPSIPKNMSSIKSNMHGQKALNSLSADAPIYNIISFMQPAVLNCFLRNAFKQHIITYQQSDRLFPLLSFGTMQGDASCKLPPIAPFLPINRIWFSDLLSQLEVTYFTKSVSSIATDDSSHLGLIEIKTLMRVLISHAYHVGQVGNNVLDSPSTSNLEGDSQQQSAISSSLKALQDKVLSKVGFGGTSSPTDKTANELLGSLIDSSINNMERALSNKYEGHDWIAGSLQRANSNIEALKGHLVAPDSLDSSSSPYVFFYYFILRTVLCNVSSFISNRSLPSFFINPYLGSNQAQSAGSWHPLSSLDEGLFPKACSISQLASPETLSRLLKLSSSLNDSLRYCAYDLAAFVLSLVNLQLQQLYYANIMKISAQTRQPMTQSSDVYMQSMSEMRIKSPLTQITAAEYYVSVAKEKRLLYLFGTRMKIEALEKVLFTRYTRSIGSLLFQWHLLRRQLNLSTVNYMKMYKLQAVLHPAGIAQVDKEINGSNHEQLLRICQTSATSVTIFWQLTQIDNEMAAMEAEMGATDQLDNYNLYITTRSHMNMDNAVLITSNIKLKGTFRIDDLEPDTLYEVSIHRDHYKVTEDSYNSSDAIQRMISKPYLSLLVGTDPEATFGFQPDSVSPNIVISSSSPLTLRNQANKKWSTARANVRLTSGVHRWDVHIDRCISKNIFVGVATREARLDNYVGCDMHGWAFLANKAVWHNKSKTKSYGDLFRSGDTLTVILDLDVGTLSFCLNDRPLGVAVEGLVGPLYPAFSLYNEDDQITIAQVRSVQDSPSSYGSFSAESLLDRLDMLRFTMQYFYIGHLTNQAMRGSNNSLPHTTADVTNITSLYNQEDCRNLHNFLTDEILEEILAKFHMWQNDVALRSFHHHGQILTLLVNNALCQSFSKYSLTLHGKVTIEKRRAHVIGVGNNKIWFRCEMDGELIGLTVDLLEHMVEKHLLDLSPLLDKENASDACRQSSVNIAFAMSNDKNNSSLAGQYDIFDIQSLFQSLMTAISLWSLEQDQVVMTMLNYLASVHSTNELAISIDHIVEYLQTTSFTPVKELVSHFTLQQILMRVLFINLMNDLFYALIPLVLPYSSSSEEEDCYETPLNHPSSLLLHLKDMIYPHIKQQILSIINQQHKKVHGDTVQSLYARLAAALQQDRESSSNQNALSLHPVNSYESSVSNTPLANAFYATSPTRTNPDNNSPAVLMSATAPAQALLSSATIHSSTLSQAADPATMPSLITEHKSSHIHFYLEDVHSIYKQYMLTTHQLNTEDSIRYSEIWKLTVNIQASYVGQMARLFECLQVHYYQDLTTLLKEQRSNSHNSGNQTFLHQHHVKAKDPALWEHMLRECDNNYLLSASSHVSHARRFRAVPFCLHLFLHPSLLNSTTIYSEYEDLVYREESRQFFYLGHMHYSRLMHCLSIAEETAGNGGQYAQCSAEGRLVSDWALFVIFVEESCIQVVEIMKRVFKEGESISSIEERVKSWSAAQVSLFLQFMHSVGVFVGLSLRCGTGSFLTLPHLSSFMAVLSNTQLSSLSEQTFTATAALAVRFGICSIYPESAFDLFTSQELERMLCKGSEHCFLPHLMYQHAIYHDTLSPHEYHIQCFWMCIYDLEAAQCAMLFTALFPELASSSVSSPLLCSDVERDRLCIQAICIVPPMESFDTLDILVDSKAHSLCVPSYSSLLIMHRAVKRLLDGLSIVEEAGDESKRE